MLAQYPAHHGGRRRARRGELDHVVVLVQQAAVELGRERPLAGRRRVGRADPRAAPLAAVEPARLLQLSVGAHHRRPAQLQPPSQVALRGEHVAHPELAAIDRRREGPGEPVVQGAGPHGPRPQERAQPVGRHLHWGQWSLGLGARGAEDGCRRGCAGRVGGARGDGGGRGHTAAAGLGGDGSGLIPRGTSATRGPGASPPGPRPPRRGSRPTPCRACPWGGASRDR